MTSFTPTAEQVAALTVFTTGEHLVLEAGAGTGKTSTLRFLSESGRRRGVYVAYNHATAREASGSFPSNVDCRTAHSLAYQAVGKTFAARLKRGYQPDAVTARQLAVDGKLVIRDRHFTAGAVARLALEMIDNFCHSADPEVTLAHVPYVDALRGCISVKTETVLGITEELVYFDDHPVLAEVLLPIAQMAWRDLLNRRGVLPFTHDHYLKMWQLGEPEMAGDFVLFDEAQDANPAMLDIVTRQSAQQIYVGDANQAIYGWRGAINAMNQIGGMERRWLSESFRFGPPIADEANYWLDRLRSRLQLTGSAGINSRVEPLDDPDAILCRTNGGQMEALINCQGRGMATHIVGSLKEPRALCRSAQALQAGRAPTHRDLIAFKDWSEVQVYANEEGGSLGTWVRLIDRLGAAKLLAALDAVTPTEDTADVVISTTHKAKGREWSSVRIHEDFSSRNNDGTLRKLPDPELMLRYVAVTRAKHRLDPGPLAEELQ